MTIYLPELDTDSFAFPPHSQALTDPNGLLALGGDLKAERLIEAYKHGIFPWYGSNEPILWWSPTPRAVFIPENFKPSRSLKKFYRQSNYTISINVSTDRVIQSCANIRDKDEMWLNPDMQRAYSRLASLGYCHSVEVWQDRELIGGLYGIQVGKIFCGESMFSRKTNASKIALWAFCEHFHSFGGALVDCQILNPHTESLGAIELDREEFLTKLTSLRTQKIDDVCYQPQWLDIPSTLSAS
ncbi:leucyl/phenylalanyl-tRNA--protein transferase [Vibrio sp. MA40-2]|uniref:leucyl/phenylalanyl-tRNA--protein transferase n=1 Tax=Vibrio sp. MA40-2 TaxID=3391828 RepID=UPI0039A617E3